MPGSNNNSKKRANLQKNLKKRLNEIRKQKEKNEVVVSSKPNPVANAKNQKEKDILGNPICMAKNIKNAFTCSKMIERNAELKSLSKPKNQTRKNVDKKPNQTLVTPVTPKRNPIEQPIEEEPIANTFVPSKNGNITQWKGRVKVKGTKQILFPSGCTDTDAPGLIKRIFTYKNRRFTKWCTRKRK